MASATQSLTTYYAKRIIGDAAAADETSALLQTGAGVATDTWILHRTNRNNLYGIKYVYDNSSGGEADKIELYGDDTPTAWAELDTGDVYIMGKVGIGYDPNTTGNARNLYVKGTIRFDIGSNDGVSDKQFIIGHTGQRYLSIGSAGIKAYDASDADSKLWLNNGGGTTQVGGNVYLVGNTGIGYDPDTSGNTYKLYVNGTSNFSDTMFFHKDGTLQIFTQTNGQSYTDGNTENVCIQTSFDDHDYTYQHFSTYLNRVNLLLQPKGGQVYIGLDLTDLGDTNYKLHVNGNVKFDINSADSTTDKPFIIGHTGQRYLSIGGGGIQAYDANNAASTLYLNYNGGQTYLGGSLNLKDHLFLAAAKNIYMNYNSTDYGVLINYNNSNTSLNACGGGIHIGYINSPYTYIFYSPDGSTRTKFFEVNSNGAYAPTRFGVNGQNTSYTLYVNGTITATNTIYANGGYLVSTMNSNTVTIGSQNTGFTHIYNSANIPFIFNKDVLVTDNKNLGSASWPWGNLYIGTANGAGIYYKGSQSTNRMIRFINNSNDTYGNGISIGGGGQTIIGGGESADTATGQAGTTGGEIMWICNDGAIEFYPNLQSGWTTAQKNYIGTNGHYYSVAVHSAVWNDYAECRMADIIEPGYCITESSNKYMIKTTQRLQPGCKVISDTYGNLMGETPEAKTPVAVAGRVLVYPYRNKTEYKLGDAVCSAPGGTVDVMTREEIMMYPERIVGTVSEIPDYELWHGGRQDGENDIQVKGRIWIYVK